MLTMAEAGSNPLPNLAVPDDPVSLFDGLREALGDECLLKEFCHRFNIDTVRDVLKEIAEDRGFVLKQTSWSSTKLNTKNSSKHNFNRW